MEFNSLVNQIFFEMAKVNVSDLSKWPSYAHPEFEGTSPVFQNKYGKKYNPDALLGLIKNAVLEISKDPNLSEIEDKDLSEHYSDEALEGAYRIILKAYDTPEDSIDSLVDLLCKISKSSEEEKIASDETQDTFGPPFTNITHQVIPSQSPSNVSSFKAYHDGTEC